MVGRLARGRARRDALLRHAPAARHPPPHAARRAIGRCCSSRRRSRTRARCRCPTSGATTRPSARRSPRPARASTCRQDGSSPPRASTATAVDLVPARSTAGVSVTGKDGAPVDLSVIPAAPRQRLCFIEEMAAGWAAIRNPANGLGAGLAWDLADFPKLWLWQEIGGGTACHGTGARRSPRSSRRRRRRRTGWRRRSPPAPRGPCRRTAGRPPASRSPSLPPTDGPVAGIDANGTVTFGNSGSEAR